MCALYFKKVVNFSLSFLTIIKQMLIYKETHILCAKNLLHFEELFLGTCNTLNKYVNASAVIFPLSSSRQCHCKNFQKVLSEDTYDVHLQKYNCIILPQHIAIYVCAEEFALKTYTKCVPNLFKLYNFYIDFFYCLQGHIIT